MFSSIAWLCVVLTTLWSNTNIARSQEAGGRTVHSLNGQWQFRRDGQDSWKTVRVPSSFESHEGTGFDGIGWYRILLPEGLSVRKGQQMVVRFEASATETEIFCNGYSAGKHLGGWTPFECDISSFVRQQSTQQPIELMVRVDERVGHNSQGFLPVFAPHFGGIWQDVSLMIRSDVAIDDLRLFAYGDPASQSIRVEVPILAMPQATTLVTHVRVSSKRWNTQDRNTPWTWETTVPIEHDCLKKLNDSGSASLEVQLPVEPALWSPATPALFDCRIDLLSHSPEGMKLIDQTECRAAFRTITADGERILLNGHPLSIRGILNWGYAPPDTAPSTSEDFWKQELDLTRSYGFNLMKFCLWVPPKRYLELADEKGVLTWMEYPTWHSRWSVDQLPTLLREFREFFQYDRNHPSVVLRSLTCETGPSADLGVIRTLYEECHRMIPGCLVEDDSSWIQWNRVHDFYDDHPYGNSHTWIPTIGRLKQYVRDHGIKPLVLGECIAADTWLDPNSIDPNRHGVNTSWLPKHFDANRQWMVDRGSDMGTHAVESLARSSKDYALEMRKFQIEALRREAPDAGYVVSVIRDFPFAEMGLFDLNGKPKWNAEDWKWHGDSMLLMQTKNDRRSFFVDEILETGFIVSNYGSPGNHHPSIAPNETGILNVEFCNLSSPSKTIRREVSVPVAGWTEIGNQPLIPIRESIYDLVPLPIAVPTPVSISASFTTSDASVTNRWFIWVFPRNSGTKGIRLHASCDASLRDSIQELWETESQSQKPLGTEESNTEEIWVAQQFDQELLDKLQNGANVLMLPNGSKNSLPQQQHWFLRGGPIVRNSKHFGSEIMWAQLQTMDLGGAVVPDIQWLDQLTPYVMLWDNHDIDHVRTHGLLFATRVGQGNLLICSLPLFGETNAVGHWLLQQCVRGFEDPELCSVSLKPETVASIRNQITRRTINLTDSPWMFRADPSNDGLAKGWQRQSRPLSEEWKPIRVGKHWEGQGYDSLDGWAWYRLEVDLPADWKGSKMFLWIDGGDDYYEVFANGEQIGSSGDIEKKKTAFEIRSSFELPDAVSTSLKAVIAIRVYDWQGAGGMFRPITLSTTDRNESLELLK